MTSFTALPSAEVCFQYRFAHISGTSDLVQLRFMSDSTTVLSQLIFSRDDTQTTRGSIYYTVSSGMGWFYSENEIPWSLTGSFLYLIVYACDNCLTVYYNTVGDSSIPNTYLGSLYDYSHQLGAASYYQFVKSSGTAFDLISVTDTSTANPMACSSVSAGNPYSWNSAVVAFPTAAQQDFDLQFTAHISNVGTAYGSTWLAQLELFQPGEISSAPSYTILFQGSSDPANLNNEGLAQIYTIRAAETPYLPSATFCVLGGCLGMEAGTAHLFSITLCDDSLTVWRDATLVGNYDLPGNGSLNDVGGSQSTLPAQATFVSYRFTAFNLVLLSPGLTFSGSGCAQNSSESSAASSSAAAASAFNLWWLVLIIGGALILLVLLVWAGKKWLYRNYDPDALDVPQCDLPPPVPIAVSRPMKRYGPLIQTTSKKAPASPAPINVPKGKLVRGPSGRPASPRAGGAGGTRVVREGDGLMYVEE